MPDKDAIADLLPEGFVALGFVVAVKCLNAEGEVSLATHRTEDITAWEAWGMLNTVVEDIKRDINSTEADLD